jgi:methionyl-tRNA formyltransferase
MIKNNNFFINRLKTIVIIGYTPNIENLIAINKKLKLETVLITSPFQERYLKKKYKIHVFKSLNKRFKKFISTNYDIERTLFLTISSKYEFNNNIVEFLKKNLVRFHPSRLPFDEGEGGFSWNVLRNDRIYNEIFSIIDPNISDHQIIFEKTSLFPPYCKIPNDFENFKLRNMVFFYKNFVNKILLKNQFNISTRSSNIGRYNPALNTIKNGLIDWSLDSHDLFSFINAFDEPYNGASTFLNRGNFGKLFLKSVHLHGGDTINHPSMSGIVYRHDKKWLLVYASGKFSLIIEKILNEKNKNIINLIKPGDRFYTPSTKLDEAKSKKIIYRA